MTKTKPANKERIANGKALAALYIKQAKLGPADAKEVATVVSDCITDLMHYAHASHCNPWQCVETARMHLSAELNGEDDL